MNSGRQGSGNALRKRSYRLFIPPLMLGLSEQLFVLMLAHLLFAPLNNVSHRLTSFFSDKWYENIY